MRFYKYHKSDDLAFTMLRHGEVYFASPTELNDSDESRIHWILNGELDTWVKFTEYILCHGARHSGRNHLSEDTLRVAVGLGELLHKVAQSEGMPLEKLGAAFVSAATEKSSLLPKEEAEECKSFIKFKLFETLEEQNYTASFCKIATNPLMWAYYADADKGFALILEPEDHKVLLEHDAEIFHDMRSMDNRPKAVEFGVYRECQVEMHEVQYRSDAVVGDALRGLLYEFYYTDKDIPVLWGSEDTCGESHLTGLVKALEWWHEDEARLFFPNHHPSGKLTHVPKDLRSVRIAGKHLKGVVFGFRMKDEDQQRALWALFALRKRLELEVASGVEVVDFYVFKASKKATTLALEILPHGILGLPSHSPDNGFRNFQSLSLLDQELLNETAKEINSYRPKAPQDVTTSKEP